MQLFAMEATATFSGIRAEGYTRQQAATRFVSMAALKCYFWSIQKYGGDYATPAHARPREIATMVRKSGLFAWAVAPASAGLLGAVDKASAGTGQPSPWQYDFQTAVTPVQAAIHDFHVFVTIISALITLFVLGLLLYVMIRFNERANPTPSRTTHHTTLEVAWTVLPALILVVIAVPSFRLLFDQLDIPNSDLTVKATGTPQWTWTYEYPDHKIQFESIMVPEKDLKPDQPRLLAVDNEMVVPVNRTIRMQATGEGIIHAFAVPSFGIKIDAIPGRLNEAWFRATREGIYYGQCSELCGRNHAFMPIAVRVVSEPQFAAWLEDAKKKWASAPANDSVVMAAR